MIDAVSFAALSLAVIILGFKVYALEKNLAGAQQVIGHMLLGTIQGAEYDEDGEVVIIYKEDE